ncbi:leucyl aminopeptidase [Oricola cellulosilytica]|uniref:Probable cytosol aminopeptidase n=1 Tax=Oricola cellulosilytica TaxID=1429082 RepID=A0A4R0PCQ3_9HYPH|nr:leucyl aminopeptidase [Oricola cellulosilytica]TCD14313.1 leucyl aminopeptidase [Oricola cellulosilytica]
MSVLPTITFAKISAPKKGTVVLLAAKDANLPQLADEIDPAGILARAIKFSNFSGKSKSVVDVVAPANSAADRILVLGVGDTGSAKLTDWAALGGVVRGKSGAAKTLSVLLSGDGFDADPEAAAAFAQGLMLRAYEFDKYKTKKENEANGNGDQKPAGAQKVTLLVRDPAACKKAWATAEAIARGVMMARDLVNEPANILGPVEFAARAEALSALGVEVEVLTEKEMKKLGMGALLGVAQGSSRPPRLVVMKWMGGKAKDKPVAFIGKGVVFDTGGISIKPAGGMEDMKGDMGGAAAVAGLMHALAARKAKANVIGIIGLVENMPDGNAQRPGDIVTSMSGQTIEVINTDAEGRLVLADALWYCKETHKPRFMIDLATLTGAVLIALGQQHAGLFSNNDELAGQLSQVGETSGEKVWRLPMGKEYDKLIDSKFADMKNVGGRNAGSITAAQFLERFVGDVAWAHLDIAGTAMSSPANDTNQSWGSGYGVRLLDRLVAEHYEN